MLIEIFMCHDSSLVFQVYPFIDLNHLLCVVFEYLLQNVRARARTHILFTYIIILMRIFSLQPFYLLIFAVLYLR